MCGITGFVAPPVSSWAQRELDRMTQVLERRGPDAQGVFYANGVGLGHRRLSILDLSPSGNQPFYSHSRQLVMVYNGEVFNYQSIAQRHGLRTISGTDTEVILERFEAEGPAAIQEWNGMFAFGIYDQRDGSVWLGRDRLGKKPLYYYHDGAHFAFASELKALRKLVPALEADPEAVYAYLHLGYIPAPHSAYKHVRKLPPGSFARYHKGTLTVESYWKPIEHVRELAWRDETQAFNQLQRLIEESVALRLVADVPVGTFLSGGIDSSLVTAVAQSQKTDRIQSFCIGFQESKFNERPYAAAVAKHIGTDHQEIDFTFEEALDLIPQLTSIYDEPYADASALPTLLVSQLARKHVTVALSGDGGDELFQGYSTYRWAERLSQPWMQALRYPISWALTASGTSRYQRVAHLLQYPSLARLPMHVRSQEGYFFTPGELRQLWRGTPVQLVNDIPDFAQAGRKLRPAERQALYDLYSYLPEELLIKTDRASMFHSLEVRCPLLDYRLVEFSLGLDYHLKYREGQSKYLLKQLLYRYVPKAMFDRPKQGFTIPLSLWMKGPLRPLLDESLNPELIRALGWVDPVQVAQLKKDWLGGKDYLYVRLWSLMQLHLWGGQFVH